MEDIAIRVTGLSKLYEKKQRKTGLFGFGKSNTSEDDKDVWALKDVSFEIKKGEVVGIIGRNGSGKSTLLRILSGITAPTEGKVEIFGKVASILDLNSNFHPELTGRENVILTGTMMGLSKKEILAKFDEIVEFSGVKEFIDTPVKYYSSGMFVRLAFSCVVNFDADIYLFDEVFFTGDLTFQEKSKQKMQLLRNANKTIIIVSHNLHDIIEQCDVVYVFEAGGISEKGKNDIVFNYCESAINELNSFNDKYYVTFNTNQHEFYWDSEKYKYTKDIEPIYLKIKAVNKEINSEITVGDDIEIFFKYRKLNSEDFFDVCFVFSYMNHLFGCIQTLVSKVDIEKFVKQGTYIATAKIPKHFFNKTNIVVGVSVSKNLKEILLYNKNLIFLNIKHISSKKIEDIYYKNFPFLQGPIRYEAEWNLEYLEDKI